MEQRPGLYVSSIEADDWEPDPDVPGSEMHELVHVDGIWSGMTRITRTNGPMPWTPPHRETIHILEGHVRIEFADGPDLELSAGDLASLPAGVETTWHVTPPFKELWFMG